MKIPAISFTSNIAVSNFTSKESLKSPLKAFAAKLHSIHNAAGSHPKRTRRYFLHRAAEQYGFSNWREVDQIAAITCLESVNKDKRYCLHNESVVDTDEYYFLSISSSEQLYFYSQWDGFENQYELRRAVPVKAHAVLHLFRVSSNTHLYLIDSFHQLFKWRYAWKGNALIRGQLIEKYWPGILNPQVALNFKLNNYAQKKVSKLRALNSDTSQKGA